MSVDPATAAWLRSDGDRAVANDAAAAAWGDLAIESDIRAPFEGFGDAVAEGARQIAFLGPVRVIDRLQVPGRRAALIGRAVTLTADAEGYRAGAVVFVIEATEIDGEDATLLRVVRRLA